MASFFESLRLAVNRVADGYEAKRQEYLQDPEKFKRKTRGDITFDIKDDDLGKPARKAIPMVIETVLPNLMNKGFEYTADENFPDGSMWVKIDSKKLANPDINLFPEFPKEETLNKLRVAEAELSTGWKRTPGSGHDYVVRMARGDQLLTAEQSPRNNVLVRNFVQKEGEDVPTSVVLLYALAKAAFPFEETHLSEYKSGARGHVFPGDAGFIKQGDTWTVAFSTDDSLGRNPKADNVLDLLRVGGQGRAP